MLLPIWVKFKHGKDNIQKIITIMQLFYIIFYISLEFKLSYTNDWLFLKSDWEILVNCNKIKIINLFDKKIFIQNFYFTVNWSLWHHWWNNPNEMCVSSELDGKVLTSLDQLVVSRIFLTYILNNRQKTWINDDFLIFLNLNKRVFLFNYNHW